MQVEEDDPWQDTAPADLVRGGLWTVLSAIVGVPLSVASNIVLARALGVEDLGTYGQILVLWSIGSMVLNGGVSAASVQWMAAARGRGDRPGYLQAVRVCGSYHFVVQAPVLALLAVYLTREGAWWLALVAGASVLLEQAFGTASVVMSGSGRNARAAQIGIAVAFVRVALVIGAATSVADPFVVWGLSMVAGAFGSVLHWRSISKRERHEVMRVRGSLPWPSGFRRFAINVGIITVSTNLVFGRSELLVMGWLDQATAAGLFVAATAIASLVTIPLDSLLGPLAPAASYYTGRSRERAADVLERSVRISGVLAGGLAATTPPAVAVLLPLMYGSAFDKALVAAQVLVMVSLLQSVLNPMATFTLAAGHSGRVLVLSVVSAIVNIGLAVLLIPSMGLAGAVVASAVGQVVHLVVATELAARTTDSSRARLVARSAPLLVGVLLGAGSGSVAALFDRAGWVDLAAAAGLCVLGFLAYRAVLATVPSLRIPTQDWDAMVAVMGRRTRRAAVMSRRLLGEAR